MIWTVLDYPRNVDVELNDLPDAIRPLDEVTSVIVTQRDLATNAICYQIKSNIQTAVDKGWFKVTVFTNDGAGGHMVSQAEVSTALSAHCTVLYCTVLYCTALSASMLTLSLFCSPGL